MTWLAMLRALPLIFRVAHRLSRSGHRRELAEQLRAGMSDGRMSQPEWWAVGHALGLFWERRP